MVSKEYNDGNIYDAFKFDFSVLLYSLETKYLLFLSMELFNKQQFRVHDLGVQRFSICGGQVESKIIRQPPK